MAQTDCNTLGLKTIKELMDKQFVIPDYQRGYRWSSKQVNDLLDDINSFTPKENKDADEKTWYCLQPVVVKRQDDGAFRVIDGQQRLTTIYIILRYLNLRYAENARKPLFLLSYETRTESQKFLEKGLGEKDRDDTNIDFLYMSKAYSTVKTWFENAEKTGKFDINNFESKLSFSTKVIWYETTELDDISIFIRINKGKIPLTNAELVKALFLNRSNFKGEDANSLYLKQLEISSAWDKIEYTLQDDAFWYFINQSDNIVYPRIEFILDLMSKKKKNAEDNFTFNYFSNKFQNGTEEEILKNQCQQVNANIKLIR